MYFWVFKIIFYFLISSLSFSFFMFFFFKFKFKEKQEFTVGDRPVNDQVRASLHKHLHLWAQWGRQGQPSALERISHLGWKEANNFPKLSRPLERSSLQLGLKNGIKWLSLSPGTGSVRASSTPSHAPSTGGWMETFISSTSACHPQPLHPNWRPTWACNPLTSVTNIKI